MIKNGDTEQQRKVTFKKGTSMRAIKEDLDGEDSDDLRN